MGQLHITGEDRFDFIESLVPGNIKDLVEGGCRLTQLTNEEGGIIDDTVITKKKDYIYEGIIFY
jgi:aminomethyltransferase